MSKPNYVIRLKSGVRVIPSGFSALFDFHDSLEEARKIGREEIAAIECGIHRLTGEALDKAFDNSGDSQSWP